MADGQPVTVAVPGKWRRGIRGGQVGKIAVVNAVAVFSDTVVERRHQTGTLGRPGRGIKTVDFYGIVTQQNHMRRLDAPVIDGVMQRMPDAESARTGIDTREFAVNGREGDRLGVFNRIMRQGVVQCRQLHPVFQQFVGADDQIVTNDIR